MIEFKKINLEPGLYIVSTPIGNLEDITIRALNTLASADIIFCENTINSKKLLSHYGINTKLSVYNDHSSSKTRNQISNLISKGNSIALITDAGTPLVSDPGFKLVKELCEEKVYVTSCPGACSAINALVLSGLPTDKFVFEGFLPIKQKDRKFKFDQIRKSNSTTILFDTGKKIHSTFKDLEGFFGDIELVILREMTKKFEERISGKISDLSRQSFRGELVLLIPPQTSDESIKIIENDFNTLAQDKSNTAKDIVKILTFKYPDLSKRDIYDYVKEQSK